ncbi:hypothetical protein NUSPORA_02172 [Nucleospora cyclopteri]
MKLKLLKLFIFSTYMIIKSFFNFLIRTSHNLNDSSEDELNSTVENDRVKIQEVNSSLFQTDQTILQEKSLKQMLDQLNNFFVTIIEKDSSSIYKHELFDIANTLIKDKNYIYKYIDSKFDFGIQETSILSLSNITVDEINVDFSRYDIAFFMGFDDSKLTIIQYNTLSLHITNLINSYVHYITSIKEILTSHYALLKASIINEVSLLTKHKKRFDIYESKYKLFIKNFFKESLNNIVKFELYNQAKESLRDYISFFYNYNQIKMKIEFLYLKLDLYIDISHSFNELTDFLHEKILLEIKYFDNLTDEEKKSANLTNCLINKVKMDQILKVKNLKQKNDKITKKHSENMIVVNKAEIQFEHSENNFLVAQMNLNEICGQLNKYKPIKGDTDKFKNLNYGQRFKDYQEKYFQLLKLKNLAQNEYDKAISSLFHFVFFEKNKIEICYYIELYFLQLIQNEITSMDFLIQYFEKKINFSINLIESKLEINKKMLNKSQNIYLKAQYKFLQLIVQENNLSKQVIKNEFKSMKAMKLMRNNKEIVDLNILDKSKKYTEEFKVEEMNYTLQIFIKEICLIQDFYRFHIISYNTLTKIAYKQFCQTMLSLFYKNQRSSSVEEFETFNSFVSLFKDSFNEEESAFLLFILTLQITRILQRDRKYKIRLKRIECQNLLLDKELIKTFPDQKQNKEYIINWMRITKNKISKLKSTIDKMHNNYNFLKNILIHQRNNYFKNKHKYIFAIIGFKFSHETKNLLEKEFFHLLSKYDDDLRMIEEILVSYEITDSEYENSIKKTIEYTIKTFETYNEMSKLKKLYKDLIKNNADDTTIQNMHEGIYSYRNILFAERSNFYISLKKLFFDLSFFSSNQEFYTFINNLTNVLTETTMLENDILFFNEYFVSVPKYFYKLEYYKKLQRIPKINIFKAYNSYLIYILAIHRITFFKILVLEVEIIPQYVSTNLLFLKEYYDDENDIEILLEKNYDMQNSQKYYVESFLFLKKFQNLLKNLDENIKTIKLNFKKNILLLSNYFKDEDIIFKDVELRIIQPDKPLISISKKKKKPFILKQKNVILAVFMLIIISLFMLVLLYMIKKRNYLLNI